MVNKIFHNILGPFSINEIAKLINAKVYNLDDEELPAIDPFAGGTGATNQSGGETSNQPGQSNGLLNNMRLVGTVIGESKKIAIFSAPDGGAFKYEENEMITDSLSAPLHAGALRYYKERGWM